MYLGNQSRFIAFVIRYSNGLVEWHTHIKAYLSNVHILNLTECTAARKKHLPHPRIHSDAH